MNKFLYIRSALHPHTPLFTRSHTIPVFSRCFQKQAAAATQAQTQAAESCPAPQAHPPKSSQLNPALPYEPFANVEKAVLQAAKWSSLPQQNALVARLANDPSAVAFVMNFTDRVMRAETPSVAASSLTRLVSAHKVPDFMSIIDRTLVRLGATFAPVFPSIVVSSARYRMRSIVAPFVGTVENIDFKAEDMSKNVNLLGEAVLGDQEALRRRQEAEELLARDGVDYVSVKVSGVTSQLNKWDFEGSMNRVLDSLRPLFQRAAESNPRVLINLDMEEYHDLEITVEAFTRLLSEPQFHDLDAGIVLQAYLPDALPALQHLVSWANERPGKGEIKIRLVKGANLAMEKVDAAIHGWEQAPYMLKSDTDANYLRCLNWVLTEDRTRRVRIGVASHNLFLLAYAKYLSRERNVGHRVGFEMLRGMTPSHTPALAQEGHGMLLYTPVCRLRDFDVAISYLFRRFEETSSDGNFLRSLPTLSDASDSFQREETNFRTAFAKQNIVSVGPRRSQPRPAPASHLRLRGLADTGLFVNEPDSDPTLPNVRSWAMQVLDPAKFKSASEDFWVDSVLEMESVVERARHGAERWRSGTTSADRRVILQKIADIIARRREDFLNAMVFEGAKTIDEGDTEVSEAVDFANYYGLMAEELPTNFESFGLVTVAAPWNFPSAIGAGGAFAALAAGNAVILKPSPNTPRCLELIAECAWQAGVPRDVLQFVQAPENEVGRHLITKSDAVILTGSTETAQLFKSWNSDLQLFAETSGKNSLVISPAADLDLAVANLVQSAFSNSGQKCSASSLAICIGDVYNSERFRRQLKDAVESLKVGMASDIATVMGPLITRPDGKLLRALTELDNDEEWLVKPKCLDADGEGRLWTPGIRLNVKPGSWFHGTEVFGPVLGVMHASNLNEALELQNGTAFGLTGGIHSLDTAEIDHWVKNIQVGNAYVNRGITGAIVRRQCFGGWKQSCVGPGAKAGGPNYVAQFGTIQDDEARRDDTWLALATLSDEREWENRFTKEEDPMNLVYETNVFRYRPLPAIAVRVGRGANGFEAERVRLGIGRCGVKIAAWSDANEEDAESFAKRMADLGVERVRVVGETEEEILEAAASANMHVARGPVVANGRYELLHYLREQSISRTCHRFGSLEGA